jgi:hypothetical protein
MQGTTNNCTQNTDGHSRVIMGTQGVLGYSGVLRGGKGTNTAGYSDKTATAQQEAQRSIAEAENQSRLEYSASAGPSAS